MKYIYIIDHDTVTFEKLCNPQVLKIAQKLFFFSLHLLHKNINIFHFIQIKRKFQSGTISMKAVTAGNHDLDGDFSMVLAQDMVSF